MATLIRRYRYYAVRCSTLRPYFRSKSLATLSDNDRDEWQQLLRDASALSRSLYRRCFRSIRHIRHGNDHDEEEFKRREEERLEKLDDNRTKTTTDPRLSMLSMLPPVNRSDELRSRAEYYQQYTHENFVQESDCLDHSVLLQGHVDRFVYLLRRGDDHRKWLLKDMKFDDPCNVDEQATVSSQISEFEKRARAMVSKRDGASVTQISNQEEAEEDDTWDDEDDDGSQGLPEWYKNPRHR